ncbi:DUF3833 domain-containing protein [Vibrio maerlii]|uniref:DUF3833 domain-containing protein n=1 Tax=Vibrio maerlii TaxID=2231648 RepID=UPI000E3E79FF|nr:DUF3833 domain-containing protein [Vibrio maerlii]
MTYKLRNFFFAMGACLALSSCSTDVQEYQQTEPSFDLFGYFEGDTYAWGMVQDYSDRLTRRFTVEIDGQVNGDTLVLVEDFIFADGDEKQRIWTIERKGNNTYRGKADDIVGYADGEEHGNVVHWVYDFELEVDGEQIEVEFDDWLYRHDEKRVFNITKIKKFGVEVGRVTLFFTK